MTQLFDTTPAGSLFDPVEHGGRLEPAERAQVTRDRCHCCGGFVDRCRCAELGKVAGTLFEEG